MIPSPYTITIERDNNAYLIDLVYRASPSPSTRLTVLCFYLRVCKGFFPNPKRMSSKRFKIALRSINRWRTTYLAKRFLWKKRLQWIYFRKPWLHLISFPGLLCFVNKRSGYAIKQHSFHSTAICEQNFEKDNLFWLFYKRNVKRYC